MLFVGIKFLTYIFIIFYILNDFLKFNVFENN